MVNIKEIINLEAKERDFLELYEMGLKHYNEDLPNWQLRYCVKKEMPIPFKDLKNMKCWLCEEYILNEGDCDPI